MQLTKIIPLLVLCALACPDGLRADEDLFGADTRKAPPEAEAQLLKGATYYAEKKFEEAAVCYRKAAELGNAKAQFNLGSCYMAGTGVKQNLPKAIEWLRKAADQGVTKAYYPLGICHYQTEAYPEAYAWALAAGATGDERLKTQLEGALPDTTREEGMQIFKDWKVKQAKPAPKPLPQGTNPSKS